jgi:hypothetical protein
MKKDRTLILTLKELRSLIREAVEAVDDVVISKIRNKKEAIERMAARYFGVDQVEKTTDVANGLQISIKKPKFEAILEITVTPKTGSSSLSISKQEDKSEKPQVKKEPGSGFLGLFNVNYDPNEMNPGGMKEAKDKKTDQSKTLNPPVIKPAPVSQPSKEPNKKVTAPKQQRSYELSGLREFVTNLVSVSGIDVDMLRAEDVRLDNGREMVLEGDGFSLVVRTKIKFKQ